MCLAIPARIEQILDDGNGIVDFGVADMGDERKGKRTPIDLVLEWAPQLFDDPLDAPLTPYDAALWLCECMGTPKEDLGFGLRRQKEKAAERSAKRIALEALAEQIRDCDDSIQLMDDVARDARELLKETPALQVEVAALLKRRFHELTGVTMPQGDLNKALREPSAPTVKARRPLTEFGNAERMLDKYGQGLMYVPELQAWFCWTGVYWRRASDVEIAHLAKETIKSLVSELDDHQDAAEFFKFCAISQRARPKRASKSRLLAAICASKVAPASAPSALAATKSRALSQSCSAPRRRTLAACGCTGVKARRASSTWPSCSSSLT